jgi:hypothetical protein
MPDGRRSAIAVAESDLRRDTRCVLENGHLYGERVWFHDTRSPARRMGVSTHPYDKTMVISLWQGNACTGTFRLPAQDAARLISTLAYGMSDSIHEAGDQPPVSGPSVWRRWSQRVRGLLRRWPTDRDTHLRLLK